MNDTIIGVSNVEVITHQFNNKKTTEELRDLLPERYYIPDNFTSFNI